jgi:ABC-type molybdate transport system substrate-binding protein
LNVRDFHASGRKLAMNKFVLLSLAAIFCAGATGARAQKLQVFADPVFNPALQEIAPLFAEHTGFDVQLSLAPSTILAERILFGAPADLFFPAGEEYSRQLMEKGLLDVALKRNILSLPNPASSADGTVAEPQYASAAVLANAENRLQAMAFLEFLTSDAARAVFASQGFELP